MREKEEPMMWRAYGGVSVVLKPSQERCSCCAAAGCLGVGWNWISGDTVFLISLRRWQDGTSYIGSGG